MNHSIFLGLNFGAFYFFGFEFRVILFFWVVEICSQTSTPVKDFRKIFEPSKMSFLCILLNVMSFSKWASITSTSSNPDAALPIVCRFTQPCLTCFSLAHKIDGTKETGAHMLNFLWGCSSHFFRFEIWSNPIFWVGKFFSYFSGFCKLSAIFLGLTNFQLFFWVFLFLDHILESFE